MCVIETRIYISENGTQQQYEKTTLCRYASDDRVCQEVHHREVRARIVETKPESAGPSRRSGDVIVTQGRHGREKEYRHLSTRDGKRPAHRQEAFGTRSYSSSPISPGSLRTREIRPAAPSPPPALPRHYHPPSSAQCPRGDCPMMSGAVDIEDRSPLSSLYDPLVRDLPNVGPSEPPRRRVTIETPPSYIQNVPILSTPAPRKKNVKPDHKRHDSALGVPNTRDLERERARQRDEQNRRDLQLEQDRLARDEAIRLRAEAQEQARLARLDQERARARETARRNDSLERERRRQNEAAADLAYENARRNARDARPDPAHERRVEGERQAREQERRNAEQRRSAGADSLQSPYRNYVVRQQQPADPLRSPRGDPLAGISPISPRRTRTAIIHQNTSGTMAARTPDRSEDIILREQTRMEREGAGQVDDPLREDRWSAEDGVREWAVTGDSQRRARMRRYRESQRRRLE